MDEHGNRRKGDVTGNDDKYQDEDIDIDIDDEGNIIVTFNPKGST